MLPENGASRAKRFLASVFQPLGQFIHVEGASGIALVIALVAAVVWANVDAASYAVWDGPAGFVVDEVVMAAFFYVAALELRRERALGELADRSRAMLPVFAALGGMVVPAVIYLAFAHDLAVRGWGVPVATDIAFAIGILALVGRRLPPSLRIFLLALAIVDDLGAAVIVAVFYSRDIAPLGLAIAAAGLALRVPRRMPRPIAWAAVVVMWYGLHVAHVHPTLAGVLAGLTTPPDRTARTEAALHPWVAFGAMPLFALANAGIDLTNIAITAPRVFAGVAVGLFVGKPLGIVAASAIAVRLGVASLPRGATWRGIALVGIVAGMGFTMALFVAELAFAGDTELYAMARLGLFAGSIAAIVAAFGWARLVR